MRLYHSRIVSEWHIAGLEPRRAAVLTLGDASKAALEVGRARLRAGGHLMLDNGAFSDEKRKRTMTVERAAKIVGVFESFADEGPNLTIVAPDVIGDGKATRELHVALAPRLRALAARGVRVIVPVQGFDLTTASAAWREAIGLISPDIVAGIPSHKAAWSDDLVRAFVAGTGCRRVHFLGGSSIGRQTLAQELRLDASSDSGFASLKARFLGSDRPSRVALTNEWAKKAERRVAGVGVHFFERAAQTRWDWALGADVGPVG